MSAAEILARPASELRDDVLTGRTTPADAVDAAFRRAEAVGAGREGLNFLLYSDEARSRADAKAVTGWLAGASADELPLAGVPVAVKDNIATLALPTSCGSRILEGYVSPYEASGKVRKNGEAIPSG